MRHILAAPISIHAPAKGATATRSRCTIFGGFQSTLPRRERHVLDPEEVEKIAFQSTLPRRERPTAHTPARFHGHFNPRSREGSDPQEIESFLDDLNFNPRSREGSDAELREPVKRGYFISIHAPAKGATSGRNRRRHRGPKFQSTLPRRERLKRSLPYKRITISIHAPAKGATSRIMSIASTVSIFQSTLPRRERRGRSAHCGTSSTFQSTLPRRERRSAGLAPAFSSMHFNPRSREGSDVAGRPIAASEPFQSTLPRRERRASSAVMGKAAAFQSTLPRRERRAICKTHDHLYPDFNPRSREGSDNN